MCLLLSISFPARAQRVDVAVTYTAQRSLQVNSGQNFWLQGGSAEVGIDLWHGWGLATNLTGTHTDSIAANGVPLSLLTATIGPRYDWHTRRNISFYGQGLLGGAIGFQSLFPNTSGTGTSSTSLSVQLGGGSDYWLTSKVGLRLIDAHWLRTELANGSKNVQNNLRLGGGATFRF